MQTSVVANPGAVVEAVVTYAPPGGTPFTVGRDTVVLGESGSDATLDLVVNVTACMSDAAAVGASVCILQLTTRLSRDGLLLDESTRELQIPLNAERFSAPPLELLEVATVRLVPDTIADLEVGDSVTVAVTTEDRSGRPVPGRTPQWSVVSGGVTVSSTGVIRGVATGAARVRASAGGRDLDLTFTVRPPSVATMRLDPSDTTVAIGGSVTYRVTTRAANGAVLTGRTVTFSSVNPVVASITSPAGVASALSLGQSAIVVQSPDGRNGATVSANAVLRVEAAPVIVVEPPSASFEVEPGQPLPATTALVVRNGGGGSLGTLTVVPPSDGRVTASLSGGSAPTTLTVRPTANAASTLPVGVPTVSVVRVQASTPGVPDATVAVTLTRRPSPQIVLDRTTVTFDNVPPSSGTTPVNVVISSPTRVLNGLQRSIQYLQTVSPWLTATIGAGTTPSTLTLTASSGALAPGLYTADVTVSATDPSQSATVRVTMRVLAGPSVRVSPASLTFGPLDPAVVAGAPVAVSVTSTDVNTVLSGLSTNIVYLGNGTGWMTTSLQSTTATPTTLQITPRPTGLSDGTYQGLVIVSSTRPGAAPDTVRTTLVVRRDSILTTPDSVVVQLPAGDAGPLELAALRTVSGDTMTLDGTAYDVVYEQASFTNWIQQVTFLNSVVPTTMRFLTSAVSLPPGTYTARINLRARNNTRRGVLRVVLRVVGFSQVAAGGDHTCGANTQGTWYCWGDNMLGQLGNGNTQDATIPTRTAIGFSFVQIVTGGNFTCGRTGAGAAFCWGSNQSGELGNGTFDQSEGQQNPLPGAVIGGRSFTQLSAGDDHACGISAGQTYCWGRNDFGMLGSNAGSRAAVPTLVSGGHAFVQVSAGAYHTCARTASGAAWCWGANYAGQLGIGTIVPSSSVVPVAVTGGLSFVDIQVGEDVSCGRIASGAAYCWGSNNQGQLGIGTTEPVVSAPRLVAGGHTFTSLSVGAAHGCGVASSGAAYCWGSSQSGQLGTGNSNPSTAPVIVSGGHTFSSVTAAQSHSCGVSTSGRLYCWGGNIFGQLGIGSTSTVFAPQPVTAPLPFVTGAAAAGSAQRR